MNIELFKRLKKNGDKTVPVNIDGAETQVMIRSPRYKHGWMAFWDDGKNEYSLEITNNGKYKYKKGIKKNFTYPWIVVPLFETSKDFNKYSVILDAMLRNNAPECTYFDESK